MKLRYLIIFIFLITSFCFSQVKNLTLNDAIKIALNNNTTLVKNTNSLTSLNSQIKSAYGNLLPNLSVNGGWNWQRVDDKGGEQQIDYFGRETTLPSSKLDTRNYSLSAAGSVTLFDGLSSYANINQKENNYESAKLDLQKLKQDIILQTVNLYFAIVSNDSLLKYQEENLKYNQQLLDQIKEKQKLKMVTLADIYSQEAQTANSELAYLQAKNNLEKSKISLLNYLSINVSTTYNYNLPEENTYDSTLMNQDADYLYNIALQNRSDYLSQNYKIQSSQNQLTIARSSFYPTLSGSYRLSSSATQVSNLFNRKTYSVGLSLNIPIFSNWNTETSVQSAEVSLENSNEDMLTLERQIRSDVTNAVLDLQTSKTQLSVSQKALQAATESWLIKKESYVLGAATYIDLQLTYNNYLQSQNNLIQAEYNYYTKQYTLLNAVGKLKL